ncbi:MAG: transglycosylase domain-containing protein [Bacteroidota bacterium]
MRKLDFLAKLRFFKPDSQNDKLPLYKRLLKWIAYSVIIFFGILIIIDLNLFWLFGKSPKISQLKNPKMKTASELYSENGKLIGKYFDENRTPITYKELDTMLVKGLIATEDVRFYNHFGIDLKATLSIFWSMAHGERRGGSTLTQQLVKNLFKTRTNYSTGLFGYIPGVKFIIMKLKEWTSAVKIEMFFSKEEILTMYLNTVDFGNNAYGIKTAAKTYFNTSPSKLKIEQSALLIGMLKAPTKYSPTKNRKASLARRNIVLQQMCKYHVITQEQLDSLKVLPLKLNFSVENNYDSDANYFRNAVARELKTWLKDNELDLYGDGLKVYTSIDPSMQKYAEEAVEKHMKRLQRNFEEHWRGENPWMQSNGVELPGFFDNIVRNSDVYSDLKFKFKEDKDSIDYYLNKPHKMRVFTWNGDKDTTISSLDSIRYYLRFLHAGFVVMEPESGFVKAWVGGINFKNFKYDHVDQSKRQPGSTFKPFVYTSAIEKGMGPCDRIPDVETTYEYMEKGVKKSWRPHNADAICTGESVPLKHAMARSINVVTVQLASRIGWKAVAEMANRLGIKSKLADVPSVCLGSADVNLLELVSAYCPMINGGNKIEPILVTKVVDASGKVIYERKPELKKVLSEETAFMMPIMFTAGMTEYGSTTQALWEYDIFRYNTEFGGKTGTSSNYSDGWFVGVTPKLIGGAWVGGENRSIHFRTSAMGEGCKTALPIFGIFMEKLLADKNYVKYQAKFNRKPKFKTKLEWSCGSFHTIRDSIRRARNDTTLIDGSDIAHDTLNVVE